MKGFKKKMGGKNSSNDPFTHGGTGTNKCGTGTNKCGTGTKLLLPCFSALVPVLLHKNFQNSLHFGFHYTLASCTASNPSKLTCVCSIVYYTLSVPSRLHWSHPYSTRSRVLRFE